MNLMINEMDNIDQDINGTLQSIKDNLDIKINDLMNDKIGAELVNLFYVISNYIF